jgi:hypothetical protein
VRILGDQLLHDAQRCIGLPELVVYFASSSSYSLIASSGPARAASPSIPPGKVNGPAAFAGKIPASDAARCSSSRSDIAAGPEADACGFDRAAVRASILLTTGARNAAAWSRPGLPAGPAATAPGAGAADFT